MTNRLSFLLINLFYPAFLGSLIYAAFEKLGQGIILVEPIAFLILILLFIFYACDYIYTATIGENKNYSFSMFALDLLSLIVLYFAINSATMMVTERKFSLSSMGVGLYLDTAFWLMAAKILSTLWEIIFEREENILVRIYSISTDAIFAVIYAFLSGASKSALLAVVIFFDVACYITFDKIVFWLKSRNVPKGESSGILDFSKK